LSRPAFGFTACRRRRETDCPLQIDARGPQDRLTLVFQNGWQGRAPHRIRGRQTESSEDRVGIMDLVPAAVYSRGRRQQDGCLRSSER
jgi:hypothetical protein